MKKKLLILMLVPFLVAFQCESNDPAPFDNLESTGLLGSWEIQNEILNGNISDMIPRCCEFLEFDPDDNIRDNIGLLTYNDTQGLVNSGTFEVDLNNQTILFIDDDNDQLLITYSIDETQGTLTIDFTEGDTIITQDWARIN
ncbi:hypothetical protein [Winogradskyella alexanderae]|uniref:Lipocalin-like domain-containing protein n=1 Tax=Winogradskyella alexanderae TaxID=2877123 RepID=A0ABS7XRM3_9FLAO|nr:hypothetical protein [Winogradskyella alexanderae]MCA0132134.1 hypothetical protein [Winogradskyella alexanderae]